MSGCVDLLTTARISGWAKGRDGTTATIDVIQDGTKALTIAADKARVDVGRHGFDSLIDPPLTPDAPVTVKANGEVIFVGHPKISLRATPAKRRLRVPLYLSPFRDEIAAEDRWDPSRTALLREYATRGLLRVRVESADFAGRAERIRQLDYGGEPRLMDAWTYNEDVRALACDPQVLRLLDDLYGREAIPMQTLNFRVGTEQSHRHGAFQLGPQEFHVRRVDRS
jgi:hypothetical protein